VAESISRPAFGIGVGVAVAKTGVSVGAAGVSVTGAVALVGINWHAVSIIPKTIDKETIILELFFIWKSPSKEYYTCGD
jgi:hypothetical protein